MDKKNKLFPYLTGLGAWALAFGCSVGWGSFVMPGTTFLPIAGPIGTALGIGLGAIFMLILANNYHYLMNKFPDSGGTYTYTKKAYGYDHGFLNAWFLIITYIAILWANATALPLIARTLLGNVFQFGFSYEIAGFHVYMGEILLAGGALILAALICLRRNLARDVQIIMALCLFGGVALAFILALTSKNVSMPLFEPAFGLTSSPSRGTFTILALSPWAYVGFESITHSSAEAKYPLKKTFLIFACAIITSALAYIFLTWIATMAQPVGVNDWSAYISGLGQYDGLESQPVFYATYKLLGEKGLTVLGISALFGIFTGLVGNYIALSRLICNLSQDKLLPSWFAKKNDDHVPSNTILAILLVSIFLPFFGRTAISWIVDVTTVGATIAYSFASASSFKFAKEDNNKVTIITSIIGVIISLFFAFEFLIPNLLSVKTLATESYLILAAWGFLGFIVFHAILKKDENGRFGRSNVSLIVMFSLIIFTSSVWMRQATENIIDKSVTPIQDYYTNKLDEYGIDIVSGATQSSREYIEDVLKQVDNSVELINIVQIGLIVLTLFVLFIIYGTIQKRESKTEVEKLLAEENSKAKTSFLSNMSHEIRTPMNAIIGLDNIALRDNNLSPKTREHLEKIGASAKHLLGLINDILDMSRIESGRMVLKDEEFSFREFIEQVNIIINGQCMDKGLRYECNVVGKVNDYYYGDDMKLKQVLINILGNSVKFTDTPGSVTLTIEQIKREDDICTLRFKMKDTGIGMDEEFIPKIFEAFSQEDATTTNRYGGSGLGMAITKNFVDIMNGDIKVESKKGIGSVFTVTVNLKASNRSYQEEHGLSLPAGIRGIAVDDDEVSLEHASLVLQSLGVETDVFSSASEALEKIKDANAKSRPYHLLLTDYKMPEMNGRDLARAVRTFDNNKTVIIMLTGYNWDIIEDETKNDGVDSIMSKPLFAETLIRNIYNILDSRGNKDKKEDTIVSPKTILSGKRILVAEDVDANAEILMDLLELEDMTSERAANGQEVIKMFNEKEPGYYDCILMDVRMPIMDGLSATEEIRKLDRKDAKTIPIIAMTANVFDEDVERSIKAGMNAHLSKPIEPELLYHTIEEYLQK